jgi:hypothetical protein
VKWFEGRSKENCVKFKSFIGRIILVAMNLDRFAVWFGRGRWGGFSLTVVSAARASDHTVNHNTASGKMVSILEPFIHSGDYLHVVFYIMYCCLLSVILDL